MKLQKTLCVLIALALMLSGCTRSGSDAGRSVTEEAEYTEDVFAMDTFMSLRAYGPAAEASVREASEELRRLDSLFSVTNQESEVYAANRSAGTPQMVSEDTMAVLEQALSISGQTGGAMDITIYPVLRTWGFTTGSYQVPDAEAISAMLPYVDDSRIVLDKGKGTVQLPEGAEMDLGALAKGYAGDKLADMLQTAGVSSALLNMGGSTIRTLGRKPDGSKWRIAVQDPEDPEGYAGVIELGAGAVNTSGGYERYFEEAGEIYWHILDPDTGYPARSGLASVTVLTDQACLGDGLSTALFVMGLDRAVEFWRARDDFEFVLIDENGDLYVSQGAADAFTPMGRYASAKLTVISRET